jgi:hypothetical protein
MTKVAWKCKKVTGLQINLYFEQPMEIQLFATFFQRRKTQETPDILTK